MKKATIALAIVLSVSVIGLGVLGGLLFSFNQKIDSNMETVKQQESLIAKQNEQMTSLSAIITEKDKKIKELNYAIAEKDKMIKKQDKQISAKKAQEKKEKEAAKKIAEKGEFMSEDSGGSPNDPIGFLHRSVEVSNCTSDSITFHLWQITAHSADGGSIDDITVSLKNGRGNFSAAYQYGGNEGVFNGEIEVIDPKTIKVKDLDENDTHLYTK